MRLGILGGTFDPVHVGHLVAAVNARHALQLDRVLLVVANEPWQKLASRVVTPALDRLAVVHAAVEDTDGIEASDLEVARGGLSYTADTVAELSAAHPAAELFLIVGADVVAGLPTWERLDEVREAVTLVVVNRPQRPAAMADGSADAGADAGDEGSGDGSGGTPGATEALARLPVDALAGWTWVSIEIPALEISSTDLRERAATGRPLDYLVPGPAIRAIRERGLYAVAR